MSAADDLRTLVTGPPGGWAPDLSPTQRRTILAAAEHIDWLASQVVHVRVQLAKRCARIEELEAEVQHLTNANHRLDRWVEDLLDGEPT